MATRGHETGIQFLQSVFAPYALRLNNLELQSARIDNYLKNDRLRWPEVHTIIRRHAPQPQGARK